MLRLISWEEDFGRHGSLEGLYVLDEAEWAQWQYAVEEGISFCHSDVLGKHSEVDIVITEDDYELKSEDQEFLAKLVDLLGTHISGMNPICDYTLTEYVEENEYPEKLKELGL